MTVETHPYLHRFGKPVQNQQRRKTGGASDEPKSGEDRRN